MNGTENKFEDPAGPSVQELSRELESLRATFSFSLLLMVVFTFCINIFLFHQASMMAGQANEAQQLVSNFETNGATQAIEFWTKLNDYGRTHPDFMPVINKYSQFINVRTNAPAKKK